MKNDYFHVEFSTDPIWNRTKGTSQPETEAGIRVTGRHDATRKFNLEKGMSNGQVR